MDLSFCQSLPSFFAPFVTSLNICVMTPANNKFTCMVRKWFPSKKII
jgi:hypothetical protein